MVVKPHLVRAHERMDYKRCQKKWYWRWRKGLVLKRPPVGALDLGQWIHGGFDRWYGPGKERIGSLHEHVQVLAEEGLRRAIRNGLPSYERDKAEALATLAVEIAIAYQQHYGDDPAVSVIATEIPLEFVLQGTNANPEVIHRLKPDMVYRDPDGWVWLMENKTAAQIRTDHLVIDDQARPYGAMAERALRNAGVLGPDDYFRGIMYNFLMKKLPDLREENSEGKKLNKDGTVSQRQPGRQFLRYPVKMTRDSKRLALIRARDEALEITEVTQLLRQGADPNRLMKTPHYMCARYCDFFSICSAEEQGVDIRSMTRDLYKREDPYQYEETTEPVTW